MALPEPTRSRALLAGWLVTAFALSAVTRPGVLALAFAASLGVFARGSLGHLGRVALLVLPITGLATGATLAWYRWVAPAPVDPGALLALNLRPALMAFLAFSVLARVRLFEALAPWPEATRLLAITLAQIHALRLVATESREALRSRSLTRPRPGLVLRSAGALTATLLSLALRNAREATDALRARGV